jgi:hypothetical protein
MRAFERVFRQPEHLHLFEAALAWDTPEPRHFNIPETR